MTDSGIRAVAIQPESRTVSVDGADEEDTLASGLKVRLLLIAADSEDAAAFVRLLERVEPDHYRVDAVTTLEQALERVSAPDCPDCLAVDASDVFDFDALSDSLEQLTVSLPVVVLTGKGSQEFDTLPRSMYEYLSWAELTVDTLRRAIKCVMMQKLALELKERAEQAERLAAVGLLAAGVAHDINQPTAFVLANLSVLRERFDEVARAVAGFREDKPGLGDEEDLIERALQTTAYESAVADIQEIITDSVDGLRRIATLTTQLKSFGSDFGLLGTEGEEVDLSDIVRRAIKMLAGRIRHRAELKLELTASVLLSAPRGPLIQATVEILEHLLSGFEPGAPEANRLSLSTQILEGSVVLLVEDNAPGVATAESETRETVASRRQPKGLSLARKLAERLGGQLQVETSEIGNSVRLTLPVRTSSGRRVRLPSKLLRESGRPRGSVLIVDDDFAVLRAYQRVLGSEFLVEITNDATEALEIAGRGGRFDFILCDLSMPTLDGPRFFEELRKRYPELAPRVAFLTGGAHAPRLKNFLASVDNPVLDKPVPPSLLIETARRFCDAARRATRSAAGFA